MNVRDDIAQVRRSVNSINPDSRLNNQFIYDKIMDIAKLLVRRDAETRKIYQSTELFRPLHCVDMVKTTAQNCTNIIIPGCSYISKSVKILPKAFLSSQGSVINVYTLDNTQIYQTTPSNYSDISKREFKGNQRYYWVENDYLYIPGDIERVLVKGIFLDNSSVDSFNDPKTCYRFLDSQSVIPDGLRMDVIRLVVQDIAGVTKRIPEDENTNMNSGN